MGHYDDIRDKLEDIHDKKVFDETGLFPYEHDKVDDLKRKIKEYEDLMDIASKRKALKELLDKQATKLKAMKNE